MSYSVLRRDIDIVSRIQFSACVLVEAQMIKNPPTQTAMAVREIRATHRFAMTGTPVENNLIELWSIFNFIMPGYLGNEQNFRRNFVQEIGLPAEAGNSAVEADGSTVKVVDSPTEAGSISAPNAPADATNASAKVSQTAFPPPSPAIPQLTHPPMPQTPPPTPQVTFLSPRPAILQLMHRKRSMPPQPKRTAPSPMATAFPFSQAPDLNYCAA